MEPVRWIACKFAVVCVEQLLFFCVESLSNGSHPKVSRSAVAGNVRPHRRGASLPSLDGGDGKNRTSPKKTGIRFSLFSQVYI